jgi:hypothetical protein
VRAASLATWVLPAGTAALLGLVLTAAPALAGGSGYNLSYSAAADSNIIPGVDLVAVATTYSSGPNLSASLTTAGTPITDSSEYSYVWLFGGGATGNSTAWAFLENNTAYLHSSQLGFPGVEAIGFTLAGATLSISVATSVVGPASGFTFNGEASRGDSANTSTYSFLGTNYRGSGTCTGSTCSGSGTGSGTQPAPFPIGAIIWPVIIVIVVIVVILLVRRRRSTGGAAVPPSPPPTYGGGNPPPPAPPPPPNS